MIEAEHRKLALMFTGIAGYTRLMSEDEVITIELLLKYRSILVSLIEQYHGTVIEFIGDGIFARFDSAADAVRAGIDIQKKLLDHNRKHKSSGDIHSRIGIHVGEVTFKDDSVFGYDVNIAARLQSMAVPGGICISQDVYEIAANIIAEPVLPLGPQALKNIKGGMDAYLIRPAGIEARARVYYGFRSLRQRLVIHWKPVLAIGVMLAMLAFYSVPRWLVPDYDAYYVEVADFDNLTRDEGADYFSAGITGAIRAQLANIRGVYLLRADQGVRAPIRLEGSVEKVHGHLHIDYWLLRRKDNTELARGRVEGDYEDIFVLQDRAVAEIGGLLADEFGFKYFHPVAPRLTSDVTAYDYHLHGLAYLRKPGSHENLDAAIKQFSTALVHDKNFARASAGLCRAYWKKYDLSRVESWASRAEEYCQKALAQDDTLHEVYEALGVIYAGTARWDQAVSAYKKAIELSDKSPDALIGVAEVYRARNEPELAEATLRQVIKEMPAYWGGFDHLAAFYVSSGRFAEAIDLYHKVLKLTPENVYAHSDLGGVYFFLGDFRKAASAFKRSVELSPTSLGYSNTGTMYYYAGDYEKAVRMFQEAIRLSPRDYRLYGNLADALRWLPGREAQAKEYYEKTIEMALSRLKVNQSDASAYSYLAFSHLFNGHRAKALEAIEKARQLAGEDLEVLSISVRIAAKVGERGEAVLGLERLVRAGYARSLIEADPDFAVLRRLPRYRKIMRAQGLETP